jgi:DNA-binding CsgD family transcriptional regulator
MSSHMSDEIFSMRESHNKYITRSGDKITSQYLAILQEYGVNNSLIKYSFTKNKIIIFFFISSTVKERDTILNNLDYLSILVESIESSLRFIGNTEVFQSQKNPLLKQNVVDLLFNEKYRSIQCSRRGIKIPYQGKYIDITKRELDCLVLITKCFVNKEIAKRLHISHHTVKTHVNHLKEKFCLNSRFDLLLHTHKMNYLSKFSDVIL